MPLLSLLALLSSITLGGCTIVRVSGAKAVTSVHFGVLKIAPETPGGLVVIDTSGLGLVPGSSGATLGFSHERMVFLDDLSRCRLVIFESGNDPQSRAFWAKALQDTQQACNEGEKDDGQ